MKIRSPSSTVWPHGKEFAFTIFDDTERGTVENNRAIYGLLEDCGMRTTKSVWPVAGPGKPDIPGPTCDEDEYRNLCLELQEKGFEMALHNATYHTADRALTERAFDRFREIFGHDPESMANHSTNSEGIYWGAARLSSWRRLAYLLVQRGQKFRGHIEGDPLFWGDLCRDHVRYVRNFTFSDLNTLAMCPAMPYHDPDRAYVNLWFAGSDATHVEAWRRNVTEATLDRLAEERGACIIYTHFGKRFHGPGGLDKRFVETIRYLSRMNGWFVPVTPLLDFLAGQQGLRKVLTPGERSRLEMRWLTDQIANLRHRF